MRGSNRSKRYLEWLAVMIAVCFGAFSSCVICSAESKITVQQIVDGKAETKEYTRKQFLKENKCSKEKPILQYYDENNQLQVEAYYNAGKKKGCGIRYYEDQTIGFVINGSHDAKKYLEGLSEVEQPAEGQELTALIKSLDASKVKISEKKNKAGKVTRYKATGIMDGEEGAYTLANIKYTYSKKGKLVKKEAGYHPVLYGTSSSYFKCYYNEQEQPLYEYCYLTHGHSETYYSYKNKKDTTPQYIICLDSMPDLLDAVLYVAK